MVAKYNNPITQKVYEIILPLLGDIMTQNVLKIQAKKLGKTEEELTYENLPKLAESLKNGLMVFLGSEGANSLAHKVLNINK